MEPQPGPQALTQFEDRLLFHLVELAGNLPLGRHEGIMECTLAERLAAELGITPEDALAESFPHSQARGTVLTAAQALQAEGLAETDGFLGGPWAIRPTLRGRRRVAEWQERWAKQQQQRDKAIQRRILEELDRCRRNDPARYTLQSRLDVAALCEQLDVSPAEYLASAQRLVAQRKIAEFPINQLNLDDGYAYITEYGIQALEAMSATQRPAPDAQAAWVEVARLKRQLQIAERTLPSLIADEELRRRCYDLLVAEGDYDRVVREACVVLEDRVRKAAGYDKGQVGVAMMQSAFSAKNPILRISTYEQEQQGAMNIFAGIMGLFRNDAGHNLIESYSQDDVIRLVAMIDLLLKMVADAVAVKTTTSAGATSS